MSLVHLNPFSADWGFPSHLLSLRLLTTLKISSFKCTISSLLAFLTRSIGNSMSFTSSHAFLSSSTFPTSISKYTTGDCDPVAVSWRITRGFWDREPPVHDQPTSETHDEISTRSGKTVPSSPALTHWASQLVEHLSFDTFSSSAASFLEFSFGSRSFSLAVQTSGTKALGNQSVRNRKKILHSASSLLNSSNRHHRKTYT